MKTLKNPSLSKEWAPLLTISAKTDRKVRISDAWRGKKYDVSRDVFLDYIGSLIKPDEELPTEFIHLLNEKGLFENTLNASDREKIQFWKKRGWDHSLDYYLWSRKSRYQDMKDKEGQTRREIIKKYLATEEPPQRVFPEGERIALKDPAPLPAKSLGDILMDRKTVRHFVDRPVSQATLSSVLWHGLHKVRKARTWRENADDPLHYLVSYGIAFDMYLVIFSVEGLEAGVYYYDLMDHSLTCVDRGNYRKEISDSIMSQRAALTAGWTLFIVSDFAQFQWLYRHERALRNLFIEAGRVAQSLLIAGIFHQLNGLPTPAIKDSRIISLCRLDPIRQSPLYSLTVGLDSSLIGAKGDG